MAPLPGNPDMVTLAREARGYTQSELALKVSISQAKLSKLESGVAVLDEEIVGRLASALAYPADFFYSRDQIHGPAASDFFHRRRRQVAARHIARIHAGANIRCMHLNRLLRSVDLPEERIPRLDPNEFGSVSEVARAVRSAWGLPRGPIKNLIQTVEDAGGIVSYCNFSTMQVDEVSIWPPDMPPVFFLNGEFPGDRVRLTLAHALGHVVMHSAPSPEMEDEANEFAAEFLMPSADIRASFSRVNLKSLADLKPYWRVSMAALLRRARDLGRVTERQYRYLWVQMGKAGYRRREPAELDVAREQPGLLAEVFAVHRQQLGYSLPQLCELLTSTESDLRAMYGLEATASESRSGFKLLG